MNIQVHFFSAFTCLILLSIFCISCNNSSDNYATGSSPFQQPINPNGDSELALLMRAMYDDAEQIKELIEKGKKVRIPKNHGDIMVAEATEPEKVATAEFSLFAESYLNSLESIQDANPADLEKHYKSMVGSCIACHKSVCPGPIVKIKKLL